ncbi:iron(III) transport system substrate-binding protein [Sphingomonas sp. PP-F2F-A104-K0414]|uniref:ABC transporter substrate-binding protein n=1 Tax=Sphingomonas sp. PP-F2F-A104-K0414 TaxID=2135661 RepID=UPI0010E90F9F|nr:ABC transporter substrate-binding protein [Sphingomonas sp. PP-F2F-A104-K0414]TCP98585.1 iron(III) transport system substrate-binding protein [Sphingomonas sp. PP-F2F-A104-K0414]
MAQIFLKIALLATSFTATAVVAQRPANYPRSYDQLISDARAERQVRIYGNADRAELLPVVAAFRKRYPGITVLYADIGSTEMYRRFVTETRARRMSADLVWSSAMDLQVKLINDGFAQGYASPEKPALPPVSVWKNMGFGVTAEPIGIVYNKRLVPAAEVPRTHAALETWLRQNARTLTGRVTTFDPARSNVGYLYLSEDMAITRDTRSLLEAIAATKPVLAQTSEPMLRDVAEGRQALAYNVIGSYALERARTDPRIGVAFLQDYTIVTSRIAFIAREAAHPAAAKLFLDFLLSREGQSLLAKRSLWPVRTDVSARRLPSAQARPIRVGPQLLVNLDRVKRQRFLRDWTAILATGAKAQ